MLNLDHQAQNARWLSTYPQRRDRITYPPELVAIRVEDSEACQSGNKNAGRRTHTGSVVGVRSTSSD